MDELEKEDFFNFLTISGTFFKGIGFGDTDWPKKFEILLVRGEFQK